MSLFRKMNPEPDPFAHLTTPEELEQEADKWGRHARRSASDGHNDSAQYARDARAAAKAKARELRRKKN